MPAQKAAKSPKSAPGSAAIGGNLAIGHADSPTFPASLAKGLYMTNGTAASGSTGIFSLTATLGEISSARKIGT